MNQTFLSSQNQYKELVVHVLEEDKPQAIQVIENILTLIKTRENLLALHYSKYSEQENALKFLKKQTTGDVNGVTLSFLTLKDLSAVLLTSSYGIRPITEPHLRKNMEKGVEKRKQKRKEFVNEKTPLLIAPMV